MRTRRAVAEGRRAYAATVERVVGVGCRQGQAGLQGGGVDGVGTVRRLGLGIDQCALPVEAHVFTANPGQHARLEVFHVDDLESGVGEAIVGQTNRKAGRRHIDQTAQPVRVERTIGKVHRTERVPVVGSRDPDGVQIDGRRLDVLGRRRVVTDLAECLDAGGNFVVARDEQVQPLDLGCDGCADLGIVAEVALDPGGTDEAGRNTDVRCDRCGAAETGRLGVERSSRSGQGCRSPADRHGRASLKIGPGTPRRAAVRRQAGLKTGLTGKQAAQVGTGRVGLVLSRQGRAVRIVKEARDVAALEIATGEDVGGELGQIGPFGPAVLGRDTHSVEIGTQHRVDHTRDCIGSIDRPGAVQQDLQSTGSSHRDGVRIVAQDRDGTGVRRALAGRMGNEAPAIQQDQGIADSERPKVHRIDIAARRVRGLRVVGRTEKHIAHLRDGAKEIVATDGTRRGDLLFADDDHRQGRIDLRATDVGTDDDDVVEVAGCLRIGSGRGRHGLRPNPRSGCHNRQNGGTAEQRGLVDVFHVSSSPFCVDRSQSAVTTSRSPGPAAGSGGAANAFGPDPSAACSAS